MISIYVCPPHQDFIKGFHVGGNGVVISHLQFADDTLCIGEASVQNLWTLKSILWGFHMVSGLKVNLWKSCLMGVNTQVDFVDLACSFLNCRQGQFPFKYLGLLVGANPRRLSTWDPLIVYLKTRLNSWGKKHISLGGRILLINSVLNSIPIFFMSFLKMPSQVVKTVVRIQREFLWGGVRGGRKISWLSWKMVCKEKREGGLGVRDVRVVNLSLLTKWRWKLLQNEPALWKDVLVAKYGTRLLHFVIFNGIPGGRIASCWWKDICAIEDCVQSKKWFAEASKRRVNNGVSTFFWSQVWIGEVALAEVFPRLFSLSLEREAVVSEVCVVNDDQLLWNFNRRRRLFRWEEDLVNQLLVLLQHVKLSVDQDLWRWNPDTDGCFSVKSTYSLLCKELNGDAELMVTSNTVFEQLWKSPAPSKIIVFSWQVLHNRIPTRDNLMRRGIIQGDNSTDCVLCTGLRESTIHLLLHCGYAGRVWVEIFRWLGVILVMPATLSCLFEYLSGFARTKKARKGFRLVWHTTIWLIWKSRNDVIFNNSVKIASECVEDIKVLTWKWSAYKLKILPCLYYEWCWDPGSCFNR
jgi:hypothetical protein